MNEIDRKRLVEVWESRVLCEISKLLWKSVCDFHQRHFHGWLRPTGSPSDAWAVPHRPEAERLPIEASQFDVHEAHDPIAAFCFR